jgi:hypothetical protein
MHITNKIECYSITYTPMGFRVKVISDLEARRQENGKKMAMIEVAVAVRASFP